MLLVEAGRRMSKGNLFTGAIDRTLITLYLKTNGGAGVVEAIIAFPKNLFLRTEIPFCLWILHNLPQKQREILFLDTSRLQPEIKGEMLPEHSEQLLSRLNEFRAGKLSRKDLTYLSASVSFYSGRRRFRAAEDRLWLPQISDAWQDKRADGVIPSCAGV